jgi:hypothetical protein
MDLVPVRLRPLMVPVGLLSGVALTYNSYLRQQHKLQREAIGADERSETSSTDAAGSLSFSRFWGAFTTRAPPAPSVHRSGAAEERSSSDSSS